MPNTFLILAGAAIVLVPALAALALGRRRDSKFAFVYVNDDGTVRELTPDEIDYLNTEFVGSDGGRPYIKSRYKDRTPDGKLRGYLRRTDVPRRIKISKA
jgi:hypothetical protein